MRGCTSAVQRVPREVHTFYKTKTRVNYMELLHPRLPTGEATKSIYEDTDTTDKCFILCD